MDARLLALLALAGPGPHTSGYSHPEHAPKPAEIIPNPMVEPSFRSRVYRVATPAEAYAIITEAAGKGASDGTLRKLRAVFDNRFGAGAFERQLAEAVNA